LVLNQSYEPISICNVQKAVVMLFLHKAELVVDNKKRCIRSVNAAWPFPSVIRLKQYHRIPFKGIMLSRKNILRRDGHRCQYCGSVSPPLTVDHVIPKARGGSDSWENLVTACIKCNNKKGDLTPDMAGLTLLSTPKRPSHVAFIFQSVASIDEVWKPYLFIA